MKPNESLPRFRMITSGLSTREMDWQHNSVNLNEDHAESEVLRIYVKSLQSKQELLALLSECSVLDYFGKSTFGPEDIANHLITNLQGSSYEVSSWSICEELTVSVVPKNRDNKTSSEDDLGVSLLSPPKALFPSLAFETPLRQGHDYSLRSDVKKKSLKRSARDASVEDLLGNFKMSRNGSTTNKLSNVPSDVKYLSVYGTIRYPKRVPFTSDPKRLKRHTLATPRDRFCHLQLGYQCKENISGVTDCKLKLIKYSVSSKVTPRNLLKSFNEVQPD